MLPTHGKGKVNDGKKKLSKFSTKDYSPNPMDLMGADGLRSSKNKKKTEGSTRSRAGKSNKSGSPRASSKVQ